MQAPICEVCLKSDMLCSACKERLETDKTTQAEIDISRFIYKLSEKVKSLQDAKIEKIIESNNILIIAGKGDGAKLVGKGGSVVKALAKEYGKSIRIVEQTSNFKEFVQNMISPATILGVNIMFTPQGETYKIRIPSSFRNNVSISNEEMSDMSSNLFGKKSQIVFEN